MKLLEEAANELGVPFKDLVSGTLDLYFNTRLKRGYPVFYDYSRDLKSLIPQWYYSDLEIEISKPTDSISDDMIDELLH
mgnify:CR=1 FL=1|tara:strand:+ start:427 stop:663 length:237 start_codon:yes stop_codon:yes gene_type:complete